MANKKIKQPKVIRVVGNITYLESDYNEDKVKRIVSSETRQKLREKRKLVKKQPREGQSKKAQNFFSQLEKDYIKQSSAMGKFQQGKGKEDYESEMLRSLFEQQEIDAEEMLEQQENLVLKDDEDKDGFKRYIKINDSHKKEIKKWMNQNKSKLQRMNLENSGIMNEYDIQKVNFSQIKMTDNLIENLDNSDNDDNIVNIDNDYLIISKNIKDKHDMSRMKFINKELFELYLDEFCEYSADLFEEKLNELGYNDKKIDYYLNFYNKIIDSYYKLYINKISNEILCVETLINSSHLVILSFIEDKFNGNAIYQYFKSVNLNHVSPNHIKNLLEKLDG